MREIVSLAWARLTIITVILGDVQGRLVAILFYYTILVPFGVGSRLLSDPLRLRLEANRSYWVERLPVGNDLDSAKRQG